MSNILIKGGNQLKGTVRVSGAKNAALPIMAAMIMLPGENTLTNVPNLTDVVSMIRMLRCLGYGAEYIEPHTVKVWRKGNVRHIAPYELVTKMRASFFVAGPLLTTVGIAKIPLPGGCAIGTRPIDIHLKGFEKLGAEISIQHGIVEIKAKKLVGANIYLDFPSVGATENLIMAAICAQGQTVIENAAREPEIVDLIQYLNQAGAKITGENTPVLTITGVEKLCAVNNYDIIPDRIEAATLLLAAAITRGNVTIENLRPDHIQSLLDKLSYIGAEIVSKDNQTNIKVSKTLKAVDIETLPYPGFPTDMQAPIMSLLTLSDGTSVITESVFENRFVHAQELQRMGANIKISERNAIIHGVKKLSGAPVKITDLRAGAALFIAGLAADGETIISGMKHVRRGYDGLVEKLNMLGADIREL